VTPPAPITSSAPTQTTPPSPADSAAKPPVVVAGGPKKPADASPAPVATTPAPDATKPPSEAPAPAQREGPEWFKQQGIPDDQNPYELTRMAKLYQAGAGINPENAKTAEEYRTKAAAIWNSGMAGGVVIPSVARAKQQIEAQTKYGSAMGEASGKDEGEINLKMQQRAQIGQTIGRMQQIMGTFTPEHFAEDKARATAMLASAFGPDAVTESMLDQAQNEQEFNKDAMNLVMKAAKEQGGRLLASEIETLKRASAAPNLTAGAAAAILAQTKGLLDWQDAHDSAFLDWRDQHAADNPAKFDRDWLNPKAHPENSPQAFVDKARKNFPYKGDMDNQTKETLEDGRAYMTKQGPMRWNAQKQRFFPYTPEQ
jgi:hypothetical protein